jgi:hypothetical protein
VLRLACASTDQFGSKRASLELRNIPLGIMHAVRAESVVKPLA